MAQTHQEYDVEDPDVFRTSHEPIGVPPQEAYSIHLASVAEKKRLWWRNAFINAFFIACWYVKFPTLSRVALIDYAHEHIAMSRFLFATVLSVYNKWMFSPEYFAFPWPLFVTTLHMFVQFALAAILRAAWPARFKPERRPTGADYG